MLRLRTCCNCTLLPCVRAGRHTQAERLLLLLLLLLPSPMVKFQCRVIEDTLTWQEWQDTAKVYLYLWSSVVCGKSGEERRAETEKGPNTSYAKALTTELFTIF